MVRTGQDHSLGSKNVYIFFTMLLCFYYLPLNIITNIEGLGNAGLNKVKYV